MDRTSSYVHMTDAEAEDQLDQFNRDSSGEDNELEDSAHFSPRFHLVFNALSRHAKKILVLWFVLFVLGASVAKVFIDKAEDRLDAPKGSQAAKDRQRFAQVFPERSSEETLVLFAEFTNETLTCPLSQCTIKKCLGMNLQVAQLFESVGRELTDSPFGLTYISYYNVTGTGFDQIKCKFSSETGMATFGAFNYNPKIMSKPEIHSLLHLADSALKRALTNYRGPPFERIGYTGVDVLAKAGSDASESQMIQVDLVTMPIALFIFALMVRSPRLLVLCVLNMLLSVVISFGALSVVVTWFDIKPLTVEATLAQALAVAMSIDYSLFLLRRFRDECKNGRTVDMAAKIMLQQAGEVILLSCLTFQAVFFGFLFLPATDLSSLGLCAIVTLLVTLCVNLTFTLAMLIVFPGFFSKHITPPIKSTESLDESLDQEVQQQQHQVTITGKKRHRRGAPYKGWYFAFMKRITTRPFNLLFVLVVYACMLPLAYQATHLQHNQNAMQISPKNAMATKVYLSIIDHFPPGVLGPFSLVVVSPSQSFGEDKKFYDFAMETTLAVSKASGVPLELFSSPVSLTGKLINFQESKLLRESSITCKLVPNLCSMYQFVWKQSVSPGMEHACVITIELPDNPFGISGGKFVDNVRSVINQLTTPGNGDFEILLAGTEVDFYADVQVAYNSLPVLLMTTVAIVFIIIGLGLHSAFVPLRLSLAVFIPLATVFGFAVVVYQKGALQWTKIPALEQSEDGFFYFIPIICVMVALGLVLDYDIFLVHRIVEHRTSGYDLQSSVIKAIWEVNSTINAAGLIMASVFGGLLLSDETAVDHFGFLMCTAVLVDTFVVQTFLIPPIVSLGDTFAFWPRRVPQQDLITMEDDEFQT
ncbi:hypothetical protein BASA81_003694 [Batrachochytrium salamandrivorans]|nr:hypothetical protein BASA81_003694 [Batrachochytrium salamandrivorans]